MRQASEKDYRLMTQYPHHVYSPEIHGNSTFRENDFGKRQLFYIKTD